MPSATGITRRRACMRWSQCKLNSGNAHGPRELHGIKIDDFYFIFSPLSYPSGIQQYPTGIHATQGILENGMLGGAGVSFSEIPHEFLLLGKQAFLQIHYECCQEV